MQSDKDVAAEVIGPPYSGITGLQNVIAVVKVGQFGLNIEVVGDVVLG